jgi:flavin reductase (DIM6/NTAB) family NADH-FMN oxidoreductase RutF
MKPKPTKNRRPWNRVNQQVYSLSTCDSKGNINMNIVTYATPATLKPKSYVIAVYRGTKTHSNLFNKPNAHFLLQGLSSAQTIAVFVIVSSDLPTLLPPEFKMIISFCICWWVQLLQLLLLFL